MFLILKKKKNEILNNKILLLLIITKLIKNVFFIKNVKKSSNFSLIEIF